MSHYRLSLVIEELSKDITKKYRISDINRFTKTKRSHFYLFADICLHMYTFHRDYFTPMICPALSSVGYTNLYCAFYIVSACLGHVTFYMDWLLTPDKETWYTLIGQSILVVNTKDSGSQRAWGCYYQFFSYSTIWTWQITKLFWARILPSLMGEYRIYFSESFFSKK